MVTNKISIELELVDKGKIKLHQFVEETKKSIDEIRKLTENLSRASTNLQAQFENLISNVGIKKAFEDIGNSIKKAEAETAGFHISVKELIKKIIEILAPAVGTYLAERYWESLTSPIKKALSDLKKIITTERRERHSEQRLALAGAWWDRL